MTTIYDIAAQLMERMIRNHDNLELELDMAHSASAHWQSLAGKLMDDNTSLQRRLKEWEQRWEDHLSKYMKEPMPQAAAPQEAKQAEPKVDTIDARGSTERAGPGPDRGYSMQGGVAQQGGGGFGTAGGSGKSWVGAPSADDLARQLAAAKADIENHKGAAELFRQANGTLTNRCNELLNKNIQLEERARKAEQRGHA